MFEFMTIRELYDLIKTNNILEMDSLQYVQLQGWIRTNRCNGSVGFIELNDGTFFKNCQLVYTPQLANFSEISKCLTGAALTVIGKFKLTPENKQPFEIELTEAVENIREQPEIKLLSFGREDEFKLEPKIKLTNITIQ